IRGVLSAAVADVPPEFSLRLPIAHPSALCHRGNRDVCPSPLARCRCVGRALWRGHLCFLRAVLVARQQAALALLTVVDALDALLHSPIPRRRKGGRLRRRLACARAAVDYRRADDSDADGPAG